ncbi:acetate kinase [Sporosarcina luteola]|nr:acetate kinase [Sporosarcina luteola]
MLLMAVNAGSSSLKFQLLQMPEERVVVKGRFERIGLPHSIFVMQSDRMDVDETVEIKSHAEAVQMLLEAILSKGIVASYEEIDGIGHRVVHGGEQFAESVVIDERVIQEIDKLSKFAPLHNPANLVGIMEFKKALPGVPAVAVFDTAFHQTMPESSYLYPLPYEYYKNYGIRKYGFHGTSHQYVTERAAKLLNRPLADTRFISCHLGNGASIAAVKGGKSLDTSMGFTPLAGVTMGTRSGNIDPALIPYIMEQTGKSAEQVISVLNHQSGMLALSGFSSDLRDIGMKAEEGDHRAQLALDVFTDRIHKYLGSYAARMGGVDAIIFTAGIGENSPIVREKVLEGLEFMGVYFDPDLNEMTGKEVHINFPYSPVKVLVIPTNEEVMIARETMKTAGLSVN